MLTDCLHLFTLIAVVLPALPVAADEPFRAAGDRPVDIIHIALNLGVDVPGKHVKGKATIDAVALRDVSSIRFDAVDFDVSNVTFARGEGRAVSIEYINDGESIEILFGDTPLTAGTPVTVTIEYAIKNPKSGLHFFGPSEADPDTPYVVWSQGESVTNRYWVPCFDHPNEMQTTEMTVTADAGNEVISNGRLLSRKKNSDGTVTFHWLQDKPHVSYLITLIVGPFHLVEQTWRGKPVRYYVPHKNRDDVERTFGNTERMLEYFSELIGVEYPWDQYAQTCAFGFGGGMENTSATTLGTRSLHDERAHLDYSADGLIAHELAHQWFGDLVTCKDWSHLWLNEGFATFMSPIWFEYDQGKDAYDYSIYHSMQGAIRGGKERPVVDRRYDSPGSMFDSRSYPKGASILHMLRRRVGDDTFWRCVKRYLIDNAHHPVETADLRQTFEQLTGRSLERFFYDWTQRPGAPALDVSYKWNEEERLAEITVKQTQEGEPFHFPLEIEFHFDGADTSTVERRMTESDAKYFVPLPKHPSMMLIDPRDAVLKEIEEHKGRDLWERQLTSAPYVTARIRAAVHFGDEGSDRDVELLAKALLEEKFYGVAEEIAEALGEAGGDKARDALLAGMKIEHPKARRACVAQLGQFNGDEAVIAALYGLVQKGDPSYRVEASAIRAYGKTQPEDATAFLISLLGRESHQDQLRSAALSALGELPVADGFDVLLEWTGRGKPRNCRTTAMYALGSLAENTDLTDEQLSRAVDSVAANIEGEQRWVKWTAMRVLGGFGDAARSALPVLRDIAANDPHKRVRKSADDTIEKITSSEPAEVQLDDLRDQIETLEEANKDLIERLDRLEAGRKRVATEKVAD